MDLPCPIPVLPILVKPLYLTNSCQTLDPATIVHDSSHLTHVPASVKTRLPEHPHLVPGHVKLQRKKHRLSLPHSKTLLLLYSCFILPLVLSPSQGWTPHLFYSCSYPVAFTKGWTILLSIPVPFPFFPRRLHKAGQPIFPFLFHSHSCSIAFTRLDNPSFPSCSIPVLALSPSKGWTTLLSILAPFLLLLCCLQKGWTTLIFILVPFLLLLRCLQKVGQPLFPFLPHSHSCPVAFTKGWTTLLFIPISVLLLPCRLQKAGQPLFPFLLHSCSHSVTFKKAGHPIFPFLFHFHSCPVAFTRLDNLSFPSCPIPVLALSPSQKRLDNPSFHSSSCSCCCPVAFKKSWPILLSIPASFVLLPLSPNYRLDTPELYFCFPSKLSRLPAILSAVLLHFLPLSSTPLILVPVT